MSEGEAGAPCPGPPPPATILIGSAASAAMAAAERQAPSPAPVIPNRLPPTVAAAPTYFSPRAKRCPAPSRRGAGRGSDAQIGRPWPLGPSSLSGEPLPWGSPI